MLYVVKKRSIIIIMMMTMKYSLVWQNSKVSIGIESWQGTGKIANEKQKKCSKIRVMVKSGIFLYVSSTLAHLQNTK